MIFALINIIEFKRKLTTMAHFCAFSKVAPKSSASYKELQSDIQQI